MKDTFTFTLSDGRICSIEALYECIMQPKIWYADGDMIEGEPEPRETRNCKMVLYVDGKQYACCNSPSRWGVDRVDRYRPDGIPRILGLPIGFADRSVADKYEAWIADVIESGKSDEVKAYERARQAEEAKRKVERAKRVIVKAEQQEDIPTRAEARRRMRRYNDTINQGGWGYVPHIYDIDEYNDAKRILTEYGAMKDEMPEITENFDAAGSTYDQEEQQQSID